MNTRLLSLVLIATVTIAGCATTGVAPGWRLAPAGVWIARDAAYSVEIPPGWFVQTLRTEDRANVMAATREGPRLQRIAVVHRENEHAFPSTEKRAAPDMLPQDLAELFVAETKASFELDVVDVLSNEPAQLSGVDGFRLHMAAMIGELRYQMIAYGMSTPDGFFEVKYVAPTLHYFDRDRERFERSAETFRIRPLAN